MSDVELDSVAKVVEEVVRLADVVQHADIDSPVGPSELQDVADRLQRLDDEVPRLRAALEALAVECDRCASHPVSDHRPYFVGMAARARAALERPT